MAKDSFDLIVIGAGATGASIAYEASKRGLRVALLEAGDIGGATSCRSTKLLHGGVRYLELAFKTLDLAQLKLVREALLERGHWLKQAPFLAHRIELALPTTNVFEKGYYRLGLGLYDALSGSEGIQSSRLLPSKELREALPLLKSNFESGVAYSDGQFDDARLNLLLALTAEKSGTVLRTYCKVLDLERNPNGSLSGVISEDIMGKQEKWNAKVIINATGTYSDSIRQVADKNIAPRILTSRGIHIVLKENLCPGGMGLLLPSTDDGRVLFVLPFHGRTQVGTTDTRCRQQEAQKPSDQEINYLTSHLKRCFPGMGEPDIRSCWAGGRPLIKPDNPTFSSSRVVREHEIETLPCGLISAMGGKWTTCRPIALETLRAVESLINKSLPSPKNIPLIGAGQYSENTILSLRSQREKLREHLPNTPFLESQLSHLQSNYGLNALGIVQRSTPHDREPISDVIPICKAEISRAIKYEHAKTPTDLLARRCRLAMVDLKEAQRILPCIQEQLAIAKLPGGEIDLRN